MLSCANLKCQPVVASQMYVHTKCTFGLIAEQVQSIKPSYLLCCRVVRAMRLNAAYATAYYDCVFACMPCECMDILQEYHCGQFDKSLYCAFVLNSNFVSSTVGTVVFHIDWSEWCACYIHDYNDAVEAHRCADDSLVSSCTTINKLNSRTFRPEGVCSYKQLTRPLGRNVCNWV